MTAAELRLLSEALSWHVGQTFTPGHKETFAAAAEVIELLAWAEENKIDVHRGQYFWWWNNHDYSPQSDKTLIGLLRLARETSKS